MKCRSAVWLLAACVSFSCSAQEGAGESVARVSQAISGADALLFESTSPWSPGGTTLALSSSITTQGTSSMQVTTFSTWHEIKAGSLSSVGSVGSKLGVDLRIDRAQAWGEIRAVISIPSQGVWDQDIGGASVVGKPVNQFFRIEYNLPAELQTKLAASYNDLEIKLRISAPSAVYHLDNGSFGAPPSGIVSDDIGDTGATGSTSESGGVYTIQGSGADIEGTADSFRFVYQSLNGDGQIVARIEDLTPTNDWTKAGVMIRDSLAPSAKNAFMLLRPSQGSAFQFRSSGGDTVSSWDEDPEDWTAAHNVRYLKPPKWLKLTRQGDVITAYSSDDGQCWWERWTEVVSFDDSQAFFGVALSAGGYGDLATAEVSNLSISNTVEPLNASCPRTQRDAALPTPTSWIVPPGRFGTANWHYTTTNPNGTQVVQCDPEAVDVPPSSGDEDGEIVPRSDGPDHPNCPDRTGPAPSWTLPSFSPGAGWVFDKPLGIGVQAPFAGDTLGTWVNSRGIWLRKSFTLSTQAQKDDLMLWGRWANGITVYVNGVLATFNNQGSEEYRYLGLSDEARAALNVGGSNVIAVRLEWDGWGWNGQNEVIETDLWDRFFDMGLTTEGRLADVPVDRLSESNPALAAYVDTFKEFMQEQGMSGAVFAVRKDSAIVSSAGLGWHNKNLDVEMPRGAKLRLASNDKIITQAAIVKLIEDDVIEPDTLVFPLLDLDPMPGFSPGANVNDITVEHLRTHTSGIGEPPHAQPMVDEAAFNFGISPDQWTNEHTARWIYSLDATDVGGEGRYSSNGYYLLRYLAERLVAPKTLEEYLTQDMGLNGIGVSYERLAGREPNEGYVTANERTWDRWMALENFLALSASAEGYANFFQNFAIGYELENGVYEPSLGGGMGGAMTGTWSIALDDQRRGISVIMIANNHGNFDEVIERIDQITYNGVPCLFGPDDPRSKLERFHFIRNLGDQARYINLEQGLAASPAMAGWWSSQWTLEQVSTNDFRLKNRWTDEYLHMQGGSLAVGQISPSLPSTHWQLVYVGGSFQLRNVEANRYLRVTNGVLATSTTALDNGALWDFCN